MPNLSARTWIIIVLSIALLACVLFVPTLRENLAVWFLWLGSVLGAGASESASRKPAKPNDQPDAPEPTADDYQKPEIDDDDTTHNDPRPDAGDDIDRDYWSDPAGDGTDQ